MHEFEIQGQHASNGTISMSVDADGRLFKRNAIKNAMSPDARKEQWLVGELDGVRCYVQHTATGASLVLTRNDLYP